MTAEIRDGFAMKDATILQVLDKLVRNFVAMRRSFLEGTFFIIRNIMAALYRFRLRLASKQGGKFAFEAAEMSVPISEKLTLNVAARNAESLDKATNYHIDAGGFQSNTDARAAGEALRVRLRLLNAILNLGLNVPTHDSTSGFVSEEIKRQVKDGQNCTVIDSVWGLNVYPDDGQHFEYVFGGNLDVRPSDPSYIFEGLKQLCALDVSLDSTSETALHILGLATQETSEKASFLASYLALEQLIEKRERSESARAEIRRFQQELAAFSTENPDKIARAELDSISGALAALREESFSSALARFARSITAPAHIKGMTPPKFFSACISARNKIAHQAEPDTKIPLGELTAGLRDAVISMIWTRNGLPPFSMTTPPSAVSFPAGAMQFRVM